jgi:hypothetical protein
MSSSPPPQPSLVATDSPTQYALRLLLLVMLRYHRATQRTTKVVQLMMGGYSYIIFRRGKEMEERLIKTV